MRSQHELARVCISSFVRTARATVFFFFQLNGCGTIRPELLVRCFFLTWNSNDRFERKDSVYVKKERKLDLATIDFMDVLLSRFYFAGCAH